MSDKRLHAKVVYREASTAIILETGVAWPARKLPCEGEKTLTTWRSGGDVKRGCGTGWGTT